MPRPLGNEGLTRIQFGKIYLGAESAFAEGWVIRSTGSEGGSNEYIQEGSTINDDRTAKCNSDVFGSS